MLTTRRDTLKLLAAAGAASVLAKKAPAQETAVVLVERPKPASRLFRSEVVEDVIRSTSAAIRDPELARIFSNCLPNTLDTTVFPGTRNGKPDTYVITGDIDAMWLRDSSAQMWPYLPFARQDAALASLIEGLVRRQAFCIALDPYANAFRRSPEEGMLSWGVHDKTEHKAGVAERKWEIDSLCYPIRLAYGFWKQTGRSEVFDKEWGQSARLIVETFRVQQRKTGDGPYQFQRSSANPTDTLGGNGFGTIARPNGMIFSMFRPSDDACVFPLFVPANLFAVRSLRQLSELAHGALRDDDLAARAAELATEVENAIRAHGMVNSASGRPMWAYEVDGFGNRLLMDDANAPGLLSLAYLGCCAIDDPIYQTSRSFALSEANPYFFRGKAAEGIGGPHVGRDYIWPMSLLMRALTSRDEAEILLCLRTLRNTTAGTGFMHEAFHKDDPIKYTRPWFAWANTLFGELILKVRQERPGLLQATF